MKYELNLRQESFGGTLFSITCGKRLYIDRSEFEILSSKDDMSKDELLSELKLNGRIKIVHPPYLPTHNFSAPDTVFMEVTRRCNLRCTHCLNNSGIKIKDELSVKKQLRIIENCIVNGVQEIRFTGGEPLVHRHIFRLTETAYQSGLRVSIGTNGLLHDQIRSISKNLHFAVVSLDGTELMHDKIRGQGSYKKAIQGIRTLQDLGVDVRVNAVIMKSNMYDIILLAHQLYDQRIPLFIRRLISSGRASGFESEILTRDDYSLIKQELKSLLEDTGKYTRGHYLDDETVIPRIKLPFVRHNCSLGQRGLVVLPNGLVHTCGFMASIGESPVGQISEKGLCSIWSSLINSEYIKNIRDGLKSYNERTCGPCTNCVAISQCQK